MCPNRLDLSHINGEVGAARRLEFLLDLADEDSTNGVTVIT
jgi:hypothetical protein